MVSRCKIRLLIIVCFCFMSGLSGCARREPDAPDNSGKNNSSAMSKISCNDLEDLNGRYLVREYDAGGEKLMVNAEIKISGIVYKGKAEKNEYSIDDIESIINRMPVWSDSGGGTYTSDDLGEKLYIDDMKLDYDNLKEREIVSGHGEAVNKNEYNYNAQEKDHIKKNARDIRLVLEKNKIETEYYMSHIEYYDKGEFDYISMTRSLNGVLLFDDYCAYGAVNVISSDGQILSISILSGYLMDDPVQVSEVIAPETIADILGSRYSSGKLVINNIVKLELVYYVNSNNEIIPAWSVCMTMGNDNYICALCFDAETGELLKDYIGCWKE